jgi:hypothetical protein
MIQIKVSHACSLPATIASLPIFRVAGIDVMISHALVGASVVSKKSVFYT